MNRGSLWACLWSLRASTDCLRLPDRAVVFAIVGAASSAAAMLFHSAVPTQIGDLDGGSGVRFGSASPPVGALLRAGSPDPQSQLKNLDGQIKVAEEALLYVD